MYVSEIRILVIMVFYKMGTKAQFILRNTLFSEINNRKGRNGNELFFHLNTQGELSNV